TAGRGRGLRAVLRIAKKQLAPRRRFAPALEDAAIDQRPAVEVVIDVAGEDEPVDQRGVEEQLLKLLQRPEPDQIAAADAHQVLADGEVPVLARGGGIADDLYRARG